MNVNYLATGEYNKQFCVNGRILFICQTPYNRDAVVSGTFGECFWSRPEEFKKMCSAEVIKLLNHVDSESVRFILYHHSMSGQPVRAIYTMQRPDIWDFMSYSADKQIAFSRMMLDKLALALLDELSFSVAPIMSHSLGSARVDVPTEFQHLSKDLACDSGPSIQCRVDEIERDIEKCKNQMQELLKVPSSEFPLGMIDSIEDEKKDTSEKSMFGTVKPSWT